MREEAHRFGRARHLVGIVGLPDTAPGETGVIVLNAGLVHRIGPFRLHVELTRRLGAAGYPTLRFDLSTLGDSSATGGGQTRTQQVCADVCRPSAQPMRWPLARRICFPSPGARMLGIRAGWAPGDAAAPHDGTPPRDPHGSCAVDPPRTASARRRRGLGAGEPLIDPGYCGPHKSVLA